MIEEWKLIQVGNNEYQYRLRELDTAANPFLKIKACLEGKKNNDGGMQMDQDW